MTEETRLIPVKRKDHQTQFPLTPFCRTRSVTRLGVSVEKVVATIEKPSNHHGIFPPARKNDRASFPAFFAPSIPIISETKK